jgi:hypothetical protein
MGNQFPLRSRSIGLLSLAIVAIAFFTSCTRKDATEPTGHDFSSLEAEAEFWRSWLHECKGNSACHLEPFALESEVVGGIPKTVDDELRVIAKDAEVFVLAIRVNIQNSILEVVSLAKHGTWRKITWEDPEKNGWTRSVSEPSAVDEDVLMRLCDAGVTDMSDEACDCDSIYLLVRRGKKWGRFAVYNPQYRYVSHHGPEDGTTKQARKDTVAATLGLLFETLGWNLDAKEGGLESPVKGSKE